MKKKIAILTSIFASAIINSCVNISAQIDNSLTRPNIIFNGNNINASAVIIDDKTYMPLRSVSEQMGAVVDYDKETKTAEIKYNNNNIKFNYYSDDVKIIEERMYIPLRTAAQALNLNIDWESETKTVVVNTEKNEEVKLDVIDDNSNFALKLNNLIPKDENYIFSPISIKYALAMIANGADEQTAQEIKNVFGIDDIEKFNDGVMEYLNKNKFEESGFGGDDPEIFIGVNLNIANSIWLNENYTKGGDFNEEYKDIIKQKYNGTAETVNNNNAVEKINKWCDENTNHKIESIINNSDFQACLANAVYFNGKWQLPFNKEETKKDKFTDRNNKESQIDFLNKSESFYKYYEDNNIKIISMPYSKSSMSMYVALTDKDNIDFEKYISKMEECRVNVSIPKFKIEYSKGMVETLKQMGINLAFDSKTAHLKNMFNDVVNENTSISDIFHKAYISIDERGTEAAAIATVTLTGSLDEPELKIYDFKANRPFTYFIRDDETGDIIFMGEYAFAQ